jgi:hypothetical protein
MAYHSSVGCDLGGDQPTGYATPSTCFHTPEITITRNPSLTLQNRRKTRLKKIPIGSGSASLAAISTMKLSEMKPKASLPALVLKIFQTIGAVRTVVPQKRTMSSMKTSNPIENNNSLVRQEVIL